MEQELRRLFVGIPIEETFIKQINDFYKDQPYDPKMRWTPNENLHVTVVFKGKTEAFQIHEIKSKLNEFFKSKPAFDLTFEKFTVMPYDSPRMLWARFNQNPIHILLAKGISEIMQTKEDKRPIPHITVARFKMTADYKNLKLDIPVQTKKIRVNKLHLYESVLHPTGPEYKILDTYFLS